MDNSSIFKARLREGQKEGWLPAKEAALLSHFFHGYLEALQEPTAREAASAWFTTFLTIVKAILHSPPRFQPYHAAIRAPFDYYTFGNDFFRPLIDKKKSTIVGRDHLNTIQKQLKDKHNVIFFANHQIEADPQAISLLLDDHYPGFAEKTIFVAGERVVTDPLAIPFSLGRHLLCIYSKRYIDHPPEKKSEKQLHNKRTMELMSLLLKEGGKSIYVAPSGGRDRRNAEGVVEVAPFDPDSIAMFYLMAKKSGTPTHFYPMALVTYAILPPPETVQVELGEKRTSGRAPVHLAIGPSLDMDHVPHAAPRDKHALRAHRSQYIWGEVNRQYQALLLR